MTAAKKLIATEQQQLNLADKKKPTLPPFITCNECGGIAPKDTFEILNTSGMKGIDLALSGICENCNAPTIAVSGNPSATAKLMSILREDMGGATMGANMFKH